MESKLEKYTPLIRTALQRAKDNDVYAIVRMQDIMYRGVNILDGKTKAKSESITRGMGISVFTKEGVSGFSSTNILNAKNIRRAVDMAANLAKTSSKYKNVEQNKEIFYTEPLIERVMQETNYNITSYSSDYIEEFVKKINIQTQKLDDRLRVSTSYYAREEEWRIARSDSTDAIFNMPNSRIFSRMTLKENGRISEAYFSVQGKDYGVILDDKLSEIYSKKAAYTINILSKLLYAGSMKRGHYKHLLSHGFAGLKAHEAAGHLFETDYLKSSIMGINGKLRKGKKIAPSNISFIDEPIAGIYGNQFISANGIKRKRIEFIKNGVINDGLADIFSAKETNTNINGCGRAQTYNCLPTCRMSTTSMVDNDPYPFEKEFEDTTIDDIYELLVKHDELKPGETVAYPVIDMGGQMNSIADTYVLNCAGIYILENPKKITLHNQSISRGDPIATLATRIKGIGKVVIQESGLCEKSGQKVANSYGGNMFFIIDKTKGVTFGGEK
ncbi:MAG: metallopeptidase TldD-related protein [Nanoarchaeota archaeon]|nr:metallopeptidase TldD-related protein [Nanoarchaeota archaeon]